MKISRLLGAICACVLFLSVLPANAAPTGIYWTDASDGTIQYADLDGASLTTLVSGLSNPRGLAVYDDLLFWTDRDDLLIRQANSDGSNIQVLLDAGPGAPRALAVTEDYIYWTNTLVDSISRMNRDGSGAIDLVTEGLGFPNGIAVTDNFLYWSDSGTLSIKRSNLNGESIVTLVSGLPETHLPVDLLVTSQHLYWATRDLALTRGGDAVPGTIQRSDLDGSNIITLIDDLVFPQGLAITSNHIYWTDQNTGKIQRSNLDGTGQTDILVGLTTPVGLSVVSVAPTNITIDIKPGSEQDCNGAIPVAILGSDTLDVTQIDPTTLSFEGLSVRERRNGALSCRIDDVNDDSYADFVCQYQDSTTEGSLTGELLDGTPIDGTDVFCVAH